MKYRFLVLPIIFLSCLSAPEFERDNIFDRDAGIPYIHNFQYTFNRIGITFGWIDGSSDNDKFVLTQKMYDLDNENDSLIVYDELDPAKVFFQETSQLFGYPYIVILQSIRLDSQNKVVNQRSDTLTIEFGKLTNPTQRISGGFLELRWRNSPIPFYVNNVLVEKKSGSDWIIIDELQSNAQLFRFDTNNLLGNDVFRISSTILNYNENISRTSSLEFTVD